jgi:hypothetical protein
MVDELAGRFAERVYREAGDDGKKQVDLVYWVAVSRSPSADEKELATAALKELAEQWKLSGLDEKAATHKALKTYCRAMVNSAGFMYVD